MEAVEAVATKANRVPVDGQRAILWHPDERVTIGYWAVIAGKWSSEGRLYAPSALVAWVGLEEARGAPALAAASRELLAAKSTNDTVIAERSLRSALTALAPK